MHADPSATTLTTNSATTTTPSALSCLLRMFWMLLGPGIVLVSIAAIALQRPPFPSIHDLVAGATAISLVAVRGLDIARWGGQTATGEPATWGHWRRFTALVIVGTAVAGLLAHAVGGG